MVRQILIAFILVSIGLGITFIFYVVLRKLIEVYKVSTRRAFPTANRRLSKHSVDGDIICQPILLAYVT
jgi:hypothetical protein